MGVAAADVGQAAMAAPSVSVYCGRGICPATDDALHGGLRAVGNDPGIDLALAPKDAEDRGLAGGAASAPALPPARAEEALVDVDEPTQKTPCFAEEQNAFAQASAEAVHGIAGRTAQVRRLEGCPMYGEVMNQLALAL